MSYMPWFGPAAVTPIAPIAAASVVAPPRCDKRAESLLIRVGISNDCASWGVAKSLRHSERFRRHVKIGLRVELA